MKLKAFSIARWVLPLCLFLAFHPIPSLKGQQAPAAQHTEQVVDQSSPVTAHMIAEDKSIQPGRPFWVGIRLDMSQGWDTYWLNPGDSGFPTQVNWQLPPGFQAGPIEWPHPERFTNDALVAYGYTHSVLLMTQITPPKDLPVGGSTTLSAEVNWLACKDSCVPGNATLSVSLPVSPEAPQTDPQTAAVFSATRDLVPKPLTDEEGQLSVSAEQQDIVLTFTPAAAGFGELSSAHFFPAQGEVIDYAAPQNLTKEGNGYSLNVKKASAESKASAPIKGVLLLSGDGGAKKVIQVDTQAGMGSAMTAANPNQEVSSFALALGLAFLGGLILNVMPCVLPVIALKIFGFVKIAHQRRIEILKHGGVFALGVLISFWILSGALLLLRAYGESIGWGFQLQEPAFVAILAIMLFLLGLSLFGVFELGTSLISLGQKSQTAKSPMTGSFFSGVLATLVATPCTGPLLGPALGFAMTLSPILALSIFTSMGLGMASPYLLFSAFPSLIRFLPKPGNWMIIFKQLMGFLMMGTVAWLIWVFGAQTDNLAVFILLACFVVMAIGAWIFGRWGAPHMRKMTRMIAVVLSGAIVLGSSSFALFTAKEHKEIAMQSPGQQVDQGWEPFSSKRIAELRAQGTPVFVDFTAKWCLICQANKMTLHGAEVEKSFKEKGVVKMMADWTRKDPDITSELQKFGRSGVPLYVLYPGDLAEAPQIMPQTLTASVVIDYVAKLKA